MLENRQETNSSKTTQALEEREMSEVQELKGITPTYQAVLNKQLGKVTDAIDGGDPIDAFIKLRTLIMLLNPTHREDLLKNDVAHIHTQISEAMKVQRIDLYQQRRLQTQNVQNILRQRILNLFLKTMQILHDGGYLEITKTIPKGKYGD